MWKDWSNLLLGGWMAISPWFIDANWSRETLLVAGCTIAGTLIAAFAVWAITTKTSWQEIPVFLLGVWLLVGPTVWHYSSATMTWNNFAVGLLVVVFASLRRAELKRAAI